MRRVRGWPKLGWPELGWPEEGERKKEEREKKEKGKKKERERKREKRERVKGKDWVRDCRVNKSRFYNASVFQKKFRLSSVERNYKFTLLMFTGIT